jgi:hypothetical protein
VNAIGPITCSDGTILSLVGGDGGVEFSHSAGAGGYSGINLQALNFLDQITLVPVTGASATFGGNGGVLELNLRCPAQFKVAGIYGTASDSTPVFIVSIGIVCGI